MDIRHPIRAIIPTLDGPVLEVLARTTRPLTGREIQRLAGRGSPNGIRLALVRLSEQGVVYAEQRTTAVYYTANRDHLAWPAVETLTGLRRTLLEQLRTELESWQQTAIHASLFGSAAREDGDATSDIDLLLVRPDDVAEDEGPWADQVDQLRHHVSIWTGNRCHVFQLDRQRLAEHVQAKDPLIESWLRDAIPLAGLICAIRCDTYLQQGTNDEPTTSRQNSAVRSGGCPYSVGSCTGVSRGGRTRWRRG